MEKIKKSTFNSGFLSVEMLKEEDRKTIYPKIPFEVETVTENRFNAALASGERIDKVVHIPLHKELPGNSYIKIGDQRFTIWKQQPIRTTNPPINVLTLKVYE